MLHIVLILLKIIGIILASILGLLLLILLIVLFVPVRYKINANNADSVYGDVRVGWLFRLIYLRVFYINGEFNIILRICGKVFYDFNNPKKKKKQQKPTHKIKEKRKEKIKENTKVEEKINENPKVASKEEAKERLKEIVSEKSNKITDEVQQEEKISNSEKIQVVNKDKEAVSNLKADETKRTAEKSKNFFHKLNELLQKIKRTIYDLMKKVKANYSKAKDKVKDIKSFFVNFKNKVSDVLEKWHKLKAFLDEDKNRAGIKKGYYGIRSIIKHILPTKCRAKVVFGTGDPYTTGQALTYLAFLYGLYGNWAVIIPDFENEILKGNVSCSGRIRLFTLLIICLKVILDKNFRQLMNNFKVFKEDF